MKEITILSGKGGTGKTSITAAFAALGHSLVLCDADVDAPDLHLVCDPEISESHVFESSWLAEIDPDTCSHCGICTDYCRFEAIRSSKEGHLIVDPFKCEGCRLCERLCPSEAITSHKNTNNHWFVSGTRFGTMVHARMGPGEENSGKLVTQVRNEAKERARKEQREFILTDGPPGTGCPAIAAITGSDEIILILEPSKSSLHDAGRVNELAQNFNIPVQAIINKSDIHTGLRDEIRNYLEKKSIPLLGEIPFSEAFIQAMNNGQSITELEDSDELKHILQKIATRVF